MDSYLENAMDYVQETFESANQWMKVNDPFRFPEAEASILDVLDKENGVSSFDIAGIAESTEEELENFMRDTINNVLIGTNSLQGSLKDRIDWHINKIEEDSKATSNQMQLVLNGYSSGGIDAAIISVLRPDLVSHVNMIDSPGAYDIVLKLLDGDVIKATDVYKKIEIYNGNRNFVNSKGSHPPGKMIHHVDVDEHSMIEIIDKFKLKGDFLVLGRCHSDNLCNYKNGEYLIESLTDDVTKKDIAKYLGVSAKNAELLDSRSLSEEDLKEFKERISSKFRINNKPEGESKLKESRDKITSDYTNGNHLNKGFFRHIEYTFKVTAWENEYFIVRKAGLEKVIVYPNNNPAAFPSCQVWGRDHCQTFIKDFSIEKLTNMLKTAIAKPAASAVTPLDFVRIYDNDVRINHKGKVYVIGDRETLNASRNKGGWQLQLGDMMKYAFDNIDKYTANKDLGDGVKVSTDKVNQAQNNLEEAYNFLNKKYNQYGFRSDENRVWSPFIPGLNIFIKTLEVERSYKELQNSLAVLKNNLVEQTKVYLEDAANQIFNLNGDFRAGDKQLTIFVPWEINLSDELNKRVQNIIAVTKHSGAFRVIDGSGDTSWLAQSGVAEELLNFDLPEEMPMTNEEMNKIKKSLKTAALRKDEL